MGARTGKGRSEPWRPQDRVGGQGESSGSPRSGEEDQSRGGCEIMQGPSVVGAEIEGWRSEPGGYEVAWSSRVEGAQGASATEAEGVGAYCKNYGRHGTGTAGAGL